MKYKLTNTTITVCGIKLYQIEAVSSFNGINIGELGGYVQSEANLSQIGNAWVFENARVFGNALVAGDAQVYGNARVYGDAQVYGNARVFGNAWVYGDAWVY